MLRNLCYQVSQGETWEKLCGKITALLINQERGEVAMSLVFLSISSSGRGLQQTLLLLALLQHIRSVLLLDSQTHLEILRQRQIYRFLQSQQPNMTVRS